MVSTSACIHGHSQLGTNSHIIFLLPLRPFKPSCNILYHGYWIWLICPTLSDFIRHTPQLSHSISSHLPASLQLFTFKDSYKSIFVGGNNHNVKSNTARRGLGGMSPQRATSPVSLDGRTSYELRDGHLHTVIG